jgi:hypothetical protein
MKAKKKTLSDRVRERYVDKLGQLAHREPPLLVLPVRGIVGGDCTALIRAMCKLARKLDVAVSDEINGVYVVISPTDKWRDVYAFWRLRMGLPPSALPAHQRRR